MSLYPGEPLKGHALLSGNVRCLKKKYLFIKANCKDRWSTKAEKKIIKLYKNNLK
jgi:hypothetical protein